MVGYNELMSIMSDLAMSGLRGKMFVFSGYDRDFAGDQNEYIVVECLDAVLALMNPINHSITWVTYNTLQTKYRVKGGENVTNTK